MNQIVKMKILKIKLYLLRHRKSLWFYKLRIDNLTSVR